MTRAHRRINLLDRFRASSIDRLSTVTVVLEMQHPSQAALVGVRNALQTVKGEAHMLGLPSLSTFVELIHEALMGRATPAKFERAQIGVVLLREWFSNPLVEDDDAVARLAAHSLELSPTGQLDAPASVVSPCAS